MSAGLIFNQLAILLWKSWITRLRHWISTIFELLTPLLLALLIAYIYSSVNVVREERRTYDAFNEYSTATPDPSVESGDKWIPDTYFTDPSIEMSFPTDRLYSTEIFYGPSNAETDELMQRVKELANGGSITLQPLATEQLVNEEMESIVAEDGVNRNSKLGLIFDTKALKEDRLQYTIRMIGDGSAFLVSRLFPYKRTTGPAVDVDEYKLYFSPIQILINNAFVKKIFDKKGQSYNVVSLKAFKFPFPAYNQPKDSNPFFHISDFIGATIAIGYVVLCPLIVKRITDEKVAKAKELLRMIGMSDWVFWLSHFISYFTIMVFHAVMFTIIYTVGWGGVAIVEHTSRLLFFTILVIYSAQTILFCMTLTTVFNRPVLVVIVTVILWILSYAVPIGVLSPAFNNNIDILGTNKYRILSSVLPNMGMAWAMALVGQMEQVESGAQWSSLFSQTTAYGSMTMGVVLFTMLMSCLLYITLIWYLDNVWPFQYGVPKSVLFPLSFSYWCPSKYRDPEKRPQSAKSDLVIDTRNHEREPDSRVSIMIKNLKKDFGGFGSQRKTAVNDLSLNIYQNQITALLGHNGAGKTTTMNMITGIFPPTSGTVLVDGYDIQYETSRARKSIGLCPQENIIFNELTVAQHLKLFAILKGFDWDLVDEEVRHTLDLLKLSDKINEMASNLSGGMKRKLQLGIALVGGTRVLILDEPTSGLDPEARRVVWDLLQHLSREKTILLTTHYMEEADVLGDRIAIMCDGKIMCCGSPMFLKKRFGAGYHLRVSKGVGFKAQLMEQTLKKYLPKAHLHSEIQSELIYALESDDTKDQNSTAVFPKLFDEIESNKEKLGISSCGLTITTMEDVFIRVGNEFEGTEDVQINRNKMKNRSSDPLVYKRPVYLSGFQLLLSQFIALIMKRFHFARRYWPMMCFQLLVPGAMFVVALLTDNAIRSSVDVKKLDLSLKDLYGNTEGFSKTTTLTQLEDSYIKNALSHGMQTTKLEDKDPDQWALSHSKNLDDYSQHYLIGAVFSEGPSQANDIDAEVWYNNEALHSLPISINLFFEGLLKHALPDREGERLITVWNHPVPHNNYDFLSGIVAWGVTCLLLFPITLPFLGASYVLFPINERISKAKLLQLMTGLSSTLFWLTNFIFDLINHSIVMIIIFILFAIFDFNGIFFSQTNTAVGLFLMLFLFGVASIPLAYCLSLLLGKPTTGFAVLVLIYLLFGVMAVTPMGIIDYTQNLLHIDLVNPKYFNFFLYLFRFVPVFSMSFGIQRLYRVGSFAMMCRDTAKSTEALAHCIRVERSDPFYGCCLEKCSLTNDCYIDKTALSFDEYGVGIESIFLVCSGVLFMAFLLIFEIHWIRKLWYRLNVSRKRPPKGSMASVTVKNDFTVAEDSDVIAEKYRIEGLNERQKLSEEAMAVIDLTKNFGYFIATDHLTFGLHKEECFGLLGVNGAGKTTTFSMLTGDLMLSDGNAFIANYSVREDLKSFQKQIGYCPQFDALLDKLTGYEMLYLFARLRGIPSDIIESEVISFIEMVDLQKHAYKCTDTYSGGNRRKLSLALAIIGCPPVIFLDEPTAGVDPTARRKIWATLVYIQERYQSAIVLTSHSMEECEALCSRLAIMVNGKFKCLGPTQHLRKKFGQGFTIVVKLKRELIEETGYLQKVQQFIQKSLSSAVLKDSHQGLLHFHITDPSVQWSFMFSVMERAKVELQLEDYLVSDTTLEQIFLAFAKTQR